METIIKSIDVDAVDWTSKKKESDFAPIHDAILEMPIGGAIKIQLDRKFKLGHSLGMRYNRHESEFNFRLVVHNLLHKKVWAVKKIAR